ncbi:MAG: orotate phosphoribosyltransferase [Methylococcales bacterium]|nr:orotate phosphoribosyltransferase [Methylococcales bacterium]
MDHRKESFIEFALKYKVLQFGSFTLKSGRQSPYFFNAGLFNDGNALAELGKAYAHAYQHHQLNTKHLFGPAYKGIPLATAMATALAMAGINCNVTFNRKEVKSHGEQGQLMGAVIKGDITVVDDVVTAGTAFREASQYITSQGGKVHSLIVALDRCERGQGETSTIQDIEQHGVRVISIITLFDLITYLRQHNQDENAQRLVAYQREYAPKTG